MGGTSGLVCRGFIETETYSKSRQLLELSDRQIDDRLEALIWALTRDPDEASRVGSRNLWVAVTPGGIPPLRIYLRPRAAVPGECELLWIEERI